jgi:Zn-dependent protease
MEWSMEILYKIIIVLVPMILSLSVHEFAHAWAAWKLGDDTAARNGRLTLNPLAHIDVIGTLLLPILLTINAQVFGTNFFFGWAKPVPVSRHRFTRKISMRTGDIIVSLAGPVSNLIIAFISAGIYTTVAYTMDINIKTNPAMILLIHLFFINIGLAIFNLLPIPPLDGHYLLPEKIQTTLRNNQMIIFIVLIVVINRFADILYVPMSMVAAGIINFWDIVLKGIPGG